MSVNNYLSVKPAIKTIEKVQYGKTNKLANNVKKMILIIKKQISDKNRYKK